MDGPADDPSALVDAPSPPPPAVDPDLSAAVSYSLAQTVETRLRGIRNYTRLLREAQRAASTHRR